MEGRDDDPDNLSLEVEALENLGARYGMRDSVLRSLG